MLGRIVVDGPDGASPGPTYLLDLEGKVVHRFDRPVIQGIPVDGEAIVLTSDDVRCFTAEGRLRWQVPFACKESRAGGGLNRVEGDLIAYTYGRISDSGVQVLRINVKKGTPVWQTSCEGLRVEHSEYHHQARVVKWDENFLHVFSRGSRGSFLEALYLPSGRSVLRREMR